MKNGLTKKSKQTNSLLKARLLTSCLFVVFFLTAGTVFSQTRQGVEEFPQTEQDSGEASKTEQNSEEFALTGPDNEETEIIPSAIPAKPNTITAEQSIPEGPPQWAKDLRRGEIIAFGSLPFTIFFTKTFMDLYRTANHNWDSRYAPGLFKGAGAIPMTNTELKMMFGIAISTSVVIAVIDHLIVKHKRNKARAVP
jgi:hypothetical protein